MKTNQKWGMLCLTLLFLALSACAEKPKEKPQGEEKITTAPSGIISLGEAKILCDNYEDRRIQGIIDFELAQNESEEKFIPTQFIDFDFETIRTYVKYVERKSKKVKVAPDKLRIYLGNYGTDGKDPNRNTVFVLPTATIDGKHGGFYIGANGNAKLISSYWKENGVDTEQKSKTDLSQSKNLNQYGSLILNRGGSGPPPHTDF